MLRAPSPALRALVAYHWGAGTRAALRATIILGCVIVFVLGSAPDALYTLMQCVRGVVGLGSPPVGRTLLATVCVAFAAVAAPRVRVGTAGWLRSLPASGITARRAATAALSLAQLPVLIAVAGAYVAAPLAYGFSPPLSRLAALPALVVAAAATALPVRGLAGRAAALGALAASVIGSWVAVAASVLLLLLADATSGTLAPPRPPRSRHAHALQVDAAAERVPPWRGRLSALRLWAALALRALGVARPLSEVVPSLLPLGAGRLVLANNPELTAADAHAVARACAGVAVALAAAGVANALLARRAPWPWPRSLPWSAAGRVAADAGALALWLLPVVATAATLGWRGVGGAAAVAPLAAAVGAAALRTGAGRHTGAAGEVLVLVVPCAVLAGVRPALAPVLLLLVPLALALGARRERGAGAARWTELRDGVGGDPAWISAR
jgi:hypothetical protein